LGKILLITRRAVGYIALNRVRIQSHIYLMINGINIRLSNSIGYVGYASTK